MQNTQISTRNTLARVVLSISALTFLIPGFLMLQKIEPFYTYFFLFAWWSYIFGADSFLYLKGAQSIVIQHPRMLITFLAPLSAFIWFIFEAINLRLHNWYYVGLHPQLWLRWLHHFVAFATVLPGLFVTMNLLNYFNVLRPKNAAQRGTPQADFLWMLLGAVMLGLSLLWPDKFFALVWLGVVPLLDPINAKLGRQSLIDEWRVGNWRQTNQLLVAGLICGALWECWNYWAGAHWIYSVPLPQFLLDIKYFQMPSLGFLGFAPFAVECFVMTELARGIFNRSSKTVWCALSAASLLFCLWISWLMDVHSITLTLR